MELTPIYKCLSDDQRLRILNLLQKGPLCVCHIMEILDSDQVKISKQLRYMKDLGLIEGRRSAQWMAYRLAEPVPPLITENLNYLSEQEDLPFKKDKKVRKKLIKRLAKDCSPCATTILQP
ncbi:MAG: ArsR/SmtB family transcription factor [Luteolibacter sp.]